MALSFPIGEPTRPFHLRPIYWPYKLLKDNYAVRSSILHQEEVDAMAQHAKFSDHHGG